MAIWARVSMRQSLSHLIADIRPHLHVRLCRAEDDLFHRLHPAHKEDPPHQAPNLFACEVLRIPVVRLARVSQRAAILFPAPRPDQFGAFAALPRLRSFHLLQADNRLPIPSGSEAKTGIFKHAKASSGVRSAGSR